MTDYIGKRLLILGGAPQACKVVTTAKAMGIYTIVADINENATAKKLADEALNIGLYDYDALISWCKANPVDGIINICIDFAQKPLQYLCTKLGYPSFGTDEQVRQLTDKNAFKKLCASTGIDIIPEYTDSQCMRGEVVLPLFIKPAESSGSRGASICAEASEIAPAIEKAKELSRNGDVIIERYYGDKPDFMVTYIFIDGKPYLQRTADRYHGDRKDGMENVGALAISPSKYTDLFFRQGIYDRLTRMLTGMGLKNCAVFFQGFVDGDRIRFYDPGIRLPGGNYENILKAATGIDVVKMFIEYSLTGKMGSCDLEKLRYAYKLNGKYAAIVFPMVSPGTISRVEGLSQIETMPSVVSSTYRYHEGDTVQKTSDVTQRFGEYNLLADSKEALINAITEIQKALVVLNEKGEDMVISRPLLTDL